MTRVSLARAPWDPAPEPPVPALRGRFCLKSWCEAHPSAGQAAKARGGKTAAAMRALGLPQHQRRVYHKLRLHGVERAEALRSARAAE